MVNQYNDRIDAYKEFTGSGSTINDLAFSSEYAYDAKGNLSEITGNGTHYGFSYDDFRRLTDYRVAGSTVLKKSYGYEPGNIYSETKLYRFFRQYAAFSINTAN